MERIPGQILDSFLKGQHVIFQQKILSNGIWGNLTIEKIHMRYVKGPDGTIVVKTKQRSLRIWSNNSSAWTDIGAGF